MATAKQTAIPTVTVMPRHGRSGITRWNSKLEIDEGIAGALREDQRAGHEEPRCRHDPAGQTRDGGFERDVAQRPVRNEKEKGYDSDLQNLPRGQDRVSMGVTPEHSGDQAAGGFEVSRPKINPRDQHCDVSRQADEQLKGETLRPGRRLLEASFDQTLDREIRAVQ